MALPGIASEVTEDSYQVVRRAVFLDRDGVINRNVPRNGRMVAPSRLEDFRILPGVESAVRWLKATGLMVIVVTNQPDVGTGWISKATLDTMHAHLRARVPVDDIKVCLHRDEDGCVCRKPKPGMILQAAAEYHLDLRSSFMVGDRWRDIEAGHSAGCSTILVGDPSQTFSSSPDFVAGSLIEAVRYVAKDAAGGEAQWKR